MILDIKEVCDAFQKDLDNLERKCTVCRSVLTGNTFILDFNPFSLDKGLICNKCQEAESEMLQQIIGPMTWEDIFTPMYDRKMQIEEARREVRAKLLKIKQSGA